MAETEGEETEAVVRGAGEAEGRAHAYGVHVPAAGCLPRQDHQHLHAGELGRFHVTL